MATRKFDDLGALDWDDTALIKAYNKGMTLRVKGYETERMKPKKEKWRVGDFCKAIYPGDSLEYEARILEISGNCCTIEFLGYNDELVVSLDSLMESSGKKARKKQAKRAKENTSMTSNESVSADEQRNNFSGMQIPMHPAPVHATHPHHTVPQFSPMPAQGPPIPQCDMSPSLAAALSSWYMAGYYTGLHQGQKMNSQQRCCCRPVQNCCHH